jgi:hypothetical protein
MKNYLTILLLICQLVAFGQIDTSKSHISSGDELIYDIYEGETYREQKLANGWRRSLLYGGNQHSYWNLYISDLNFKKDPTQPVLYRFKDGKPFTGTVQDTTYNGMLLEETRSTRYDLPFVLFRANCTNGILKGKGTLSVIINNNGVFNELIISKCLFENGEIIGICKSWNINSINYTVNSGIIKISKQLTDFSELVKSLELMELTYVKGKSEWIQKTVIKTNGEKETTNR